MKTNTNFLAAGIDAPEIDEAARDRARRTVARFATDAGDCAELLAMLGLTPAPAAPEPVEVDPEPVGRRCACGARVWAEGNGVCRRCRWPVPASQVRDIVLRLKAVTHLSARQIAVRVGVKPGSLTARISPAGIEDKWMSQKVFDDLNAWLMAVTS